MGLVAALIWAGIVSFGPVHLDFWTELGLIFIGAFILGALGAAAEIMRAILPFMGTRRSGKIAEVLAVQHFRQKAVIEAGTGSTPGPRIQRPAGVAKPLTAA
ncbi:hypothetical protein SEA_POWERPUFF_30 [Arthrobacter phage Powerpuff]|nr:hypothetical protein SEA_POWERPUFF_30 [Arthrobacter phage Powerpuff]